MPQPLRVLIAEDNPVDAELVVRELRRAGFAPEWQRVDTEAEYVAGLHAGLDVILSDYAMPQFSGPRALTLLRERGLDIPFIIVSGTIGEDIAVAAMKEGAADYLLKDRLARLGPAIEHAVEQGLLRRERQHAEREVREREHRHRQLIQALPTAVYTCDVEGRIIFYNDAAVKLWGRTPEVGEDRWCGSWRLYDHDGQSLAHEDCPMANAIREGRSVRDREIIVERPDGSRFVVLSHPEPLRDASGALTGAVNMLVDLTERKKLEQQFLRSQRMESIGTLAGGIAHDLNNILSPIMMSVPLLRRELAAAQREEIITTIEMSAERGAQVIRQVLTFGRGVEGERRPLQVGAQIEELLKIMRGTFPKNLAIESTLEPSLWPVIGDATQLHQVLLNLCVNARDAMPEGGRLRLHAANLDLDPSYASMLPEATPGPHVLIEVGDTGAGIAPEIVERIFDPFFTTKAVGKGTGLGLSTVLGIVKNHGGFIHVNTQLGKGSTFQVFLPASLNHEAVSVAALDGPIARGRSEVVLVVDDEAGVRGAARIALETSGYRVLLAADGTEALAVFAMNSKNIAAVLTDLMMPLMDGVALIRALRTMAPDLPIIASSGLGERAQLAELKALGVETILHKPYGASILLRTMQDSLRPHATAPTA